MTRSTRSTDISAAVACYRFLQQGVARDLREQAGRSKPDVAIHLGVDVATLERWERGESLPVGHRASAYGQVLQAFEASRQHESSTHITG